MPSKKDPLNTLKSLYEDNTCERWRVLKGLSQQELAHKSGLTRAALNRIVNGHAQPRETTLARLAKALDITLSELHRGPENEVSSQIKKSESVQTVGKRKEPFSPTENDAKIIGILLQLRRANSKQLEHIMNYVKRYLDKH